MGVKALALLRPSRAVRFKAIVTVGKRASDELSRVHAPLCCRDTCSPVGNLIKQRSKKVVQIEWTSNVEKPGDPELLLGTCGKTPL